MGADQGGKPPDGRTKNTVWDLLKHGIFEADPVAAGVMLAALCAAVLLYLIRRVRRR